MKNLNYDLFKRQAIAAQPATTRVSLSEIDVVDENTLMYKGYPLNLSKAALRNLAGVLKLPPKFMLEFEQLIGKNAKDKFLNFMKDAKTAKNNQTITLIGDPKTKTIVGIQAGDTMPYEMFFNTFENMMNLHPFDIMDMTFHNGKLAVSASLKTSKFAVNNIDSENFYPGFTFMSSYSKGTGIENYIYRLICSNGMIGTGNNEKLMFGGIDGVQPSEIFFRGIENLAKSGFIPENFQQNVARAGQTMASFNELNSAASVLKRGSDLTNDYIDAFVPINRIKAEFLTNEF